MNDDGIMNEFVDEFNGMDCFEVCKVVVVKLELLGNLVKIEKMIYFVGYLE